MSGYQIGELALIFPDLAKQDFAALVEDIRRSGLLDPITVWQGEIIDGRHRYLACLEAGVAPRFQCLDDDANPFLYLVSNCCGESAVSAWRGPSTALIRTCSTGSTKAVLSQVGRRAERNLAATCPGPGEAGAPARTSMCAGFFVVREPGRRPAWSIRSARRR